MEGRHFEDSHSLPGAAIFAHSLISLAATE